MIDTTISFKLSDVITRDGQIGLYADQAIQAGMFIVEKAYIDESPANFGVLRQNIITKRMGPLNYVVESRAQDRGRSYPLFLFQGTGKLKNAPDFGFTTGRVRAGDVAYGVGGIRPNKASYRAVKKARSKFMDFVKTKLSTNL